MPKEVDVLPGNGRDSLQQFHGFLVVGRLVAVQYPESRMEL